MLAPLQLLSAQQGLMQTDLCTDFARLHTEYLRWVHDGLQKAFGSKRAPKVSVHALTDETTKMLTWIAQLSPSQGCFYWVVADDRVVGMGGVRCLSAEVFELKRIYVSPERQGQGMGALLVQQLLGDATKMGATTLVLDTAPFMHAAHRLYQRFGFKDCAAYQGTDAPMQLRNEWRYMSLAKPGILL